MSDPSKNYVLLAEDNPNDIELTKLAFQRNNILNDIHVVEDGEQALNFFFEENEIIENHGFPSLVLLDIKMPKISGLEVLEKLRNHDKTKTLPVVILTSSKEQEDVIQSYESGANSYIRKPVDFKSFVDAVKQLGLYWLMLNEPPYPS
jgi:two-component system response regulator